jgi:peptidylprolyl isomerase
VFLNSKLAPAAVNNFIVLARYHYYDGAPLTQIISRTTMLVGADSAGTSGHAWATPCRASTPRRAPSSRWARCSCRRCPGGQRQLRRQLMLALGEKAADLPPDITNFGPDPRRHHHPERHRQGRHRVGGPTQLITITSVTIELAPVSSTTTRAEPPAGRAIRPALAGLLGCRPMGTDKRQRQKEGRQARIAAAEAAQRKAATRQRIISFAILAVVIVALIAAITWFTNRNSDDSTVATNDTTSSSVPDSSTPSTAALESAAGKPCVPLADPLPTGAPDVPIVVGPPPTELVKQDLTVGTGAEVQAGDTVTVNYIGVSCSTGKIFDSSYSRGQPATFSLDQVIPGWTQGIPGMKVGGSRLLGIPANWPTAPPARRREASPRRGAGSWST